MHCKDDPIYIFLEVKLRGLVPNSHVHVSVGDLLGTMQRSFISGNIGIEYLVQCLSVESGEQYALSSLLKLFQIMQRRQCIVLQAPP
jgi:hypothetical protein